MKNLHVTLVNPYSMNLAKFGKKSLTMVQLLKLMAKNICKKSFEPCIMFISMTVINLNTIFFIRSDKEEHFSPYDYFAEMHG